MLEAIIIEIFQIKYATAIIVLIFKAIQHGHLDCVELLARRTHNFDERDQNGITPLHAAISSNQPEISEFLIKQVKANVDEGDNVSVYSIGYVSALVTCIYWGYRGLLLLFETIVLVVKF